MAKQRKKAKAAAKAAKKAGRTPAHILKAAEIGARQEAFSHPWNPNSELYGVRLGEALRLTRVGVSIARIPAGKESFAPHAHRLEEEWLYILMGEGTALVGEKEIPVGMGDFLAFPAPQAAHHLKNTGAEDLVYLMGGEKLPLDVVDFPAQAKIVLWEQGRATAFDAGAGADLFAPPVKPAKKRKKPTAKP